MNILLNEQNLTKYEKYEIENLLARQDESISSDLEQMWYLMDLVWDDFGCDNASLNWDKIGKFYSHPVWLLNGLFIEQHNVSMGHRHAISKWVINQQFKYVVDYGGGFGTLARLMAEKNLNLKVDIYEPHPSEFGLKRAAEFTNIDIVDHLKNNYDCLLSTDVLEHVADPLKDLSVMIKSVKIGGYLIIANAFSPMIKCHLPQDFHFRHTFNMFARLIGLEVLGHLEGSHATIYKKTNEYKPDWKRIRLLEKVSRKIFPQIKNSGPLGIETPTQLIKEILKQPLRPIKRLIIR